LTNLSPFLRRALHALGGITPSPDAHSPRKKSFPRVNVPGSLSLLTGFLFSSTPDSRTSFPSSSSFIGVHKRISNAPSRASPASNVLFRFFPFSGFALADPSPQLFPRLPSRRLRKASKMVFLFGPFFGTAPLPQKRRVSFLLPRFLQGQFFS